MRDKTRYLLIFILSCFLIFSVGSIIKTNLDYNEAEDEYSNLSGAFTSSETTTQEQEGQSTMNQEIIVEQNQGIINLPANNENLSSQENDKLSFKKIDFENLTSLNSDVVGWITLPGTIIDYPIVHSHDNKEYLKLTFLKESNSAGSIFIDKNNSSDFSDYNTIIYGHNMKNGTMFQALGKYKDQNFYKENPYFQIYTLKDESNYKIISCYYTRYNTDAYSQDFTNDAEYINWLEKISNRSHYKVEEYDTSKKTITLSTCSGASGSGERWVVHLQKVD